MRKRVVITGLGCIGPLGNDAQTSWENAIAGKSGGGPITRFDTDGFRSRIAAEVKDFDSVPLFGRKESRRMDLYTQYTLAASLEAIQESGLEINDGNRDRIGAVIGTGIGGINSLAKQTEVLRKRGPLKVSPFVVPMMLADSAGGMVAIHYGIRGPNITVVTACATGTNCIGEATEVIRRGQADVMLAGSSEAAITAIAVAGLSAMTALTTRNDEPETASRPFDKTRDGFLIGEGAAILVLESLEFAQSRGAKILAELRGYGSNNDAFHISAPAENGRGAALCMQMALDDFGMTRESIDYINAHGTSTPLNDGNETTAIKTVFGEQVYDIPVSSTKSMTGHLMGAAGAIEAFFCVKAIQDNIIPPTINYRFPDEECDLDYVPNEARPARLDNVMSNSFGFSGHNACIIFSRYQPQDI
jgi:3-oxoacyl-[acyl-carrier-protein] synthase II